ncbi:MAG: hypothetical protein J6113_01000 [Lachnospiraceae bacterium]|nr:hypothetical protein [Lachnospiraceae bacterium]
MNSGEIFRMYKDAESGIFRVFSGDKVLFLQETGEETFSFSCSPDEFEKYWSRFFDLETDYAGLYKKALRSGPYIADCAASSYGVRVLNQDLFEMMISFIISQQKRIPEIRKCIEALCARFGEKKCLNGFEYHAFPDAKAIAAAGPDGVKGLSLGYRERYIYETAVKYVADDFIKSPAFRALSFDEAKAYLKQYCGIGEKVANCICLFALGYKDAFPIDVHIKDILHREFNVGDDNYRTLSDAVFTKAAADRFADFAGAKGIIQQWIFAHEIK